MRQTLTVIQLIVSIVLICLILIQARGTGFGRGSSGSFTRRGLEKLIFRFTFVATGVFLITAILSLLI